MVTQVLVIGYVREDIMATNKISSTFMDATIDNIQRLFQQNQEKEKSIMELEEILQQVNIDERSLLSLNSSAKRVMNDLEGAIIGMYANIHLFQNAVVIVIEENNQIQGNLIEYNTICEVLANINTWIAKNPDAPPKLYTPSKSTRMIDLYTLDH